MSGADLKGKTRTGLYWTTLNQLSNYGIQFLIGIVMARLLSPEDFGISVLPAVFLAIAAVFIDCGFSSAMVRKPDLTEQDISTAFYYSLMVGVTCYVVIYCLSPWIAAFYQVPILERLIRWAALSFLINPLTTPQTILLSRRLDFKTPTIVEMVSRIMMGICGITMAYLGYGVWALIISTLVSNFMSLVLKTVVVRWYPKTGWSKTSFRYLWGYGNKLVASYLIGNIYENIVPVIVGKFYSPALLGIYDRAQHYSKLIAVSSTNIFQQVSFPVLSKIQENDQELRNGYRRILKAAAFMTFPLMMLLAALAKPLVLLLLTEKWEGSVIFLQLMCFPMMWYPVHAINLNILQVKGRTDAFLKLEMLKRGFGVIALAITLPIGLIAVVLSSWVTNIISLFLNTYYTQRIIHYSFIQQVSDLLPTLLLSIFMFGVVLSITCFIESYIVQIIAGSLIGFVIFSIGSILFRFPEIQDLKYMLHIDIRAHEKI